MADDKPTVVVPITCERHRYDFLVRRMHIGPNDPRIAAEVTLSLLLFRLTVSDPRIVARADGDSYNLSLVLAELGCMACWSQEYYRRAYRCCQKGIEHAAAVARGDKAEQGFPPPNAPEPDANSTT
jgi:hypothetical protein